MAGLPHPSLLSLLSPVQIHQSERLHLDSALASTILQSTFCILHLDGAVVAGNMVLSFPVFVPFVLLL